MPANRLPTNAKIRKYVDCHKFFFELCGKQSPYEKNKTRLYRLCNTRVKEQHIPVTSMQNKIVFGTNVIENIQGETATRCTCRRRKRQAA